MRIGADLVQQLVTVHARHLEVGDQDLVAAEAQLLEGVAPVDRGASRQPLGGEEVLGELGA